MNEGVVALLEASHCSVTASLVADCVCTLHHRCYLTFHLSPSLPPPSHVQYCCRCCCCFSLHSWQLSPSCAAHVTHTHITHNTTHTNSQHQAEFLLRAVRKWDEDGVPDPEASAFGEVRAREIRTQGPRRYCFAQLLAVFVANSVSCTAHVCGQPTFGCIASSYSCWLSVPTPCLSPLSPCVCAYLTTTL